VTLSLSTCLRKQSLVSVHRRDVDDNGIQGFLIGLSDELIALEYVYDFQVDGVMVLRRSDITDVQRTGTDQFQESLLKREGIRPSTQLQSPLDLGSWKSILEQFSREHEYMILERELGPAPGFAIGRAVRITAAQIELQTFSGTGRWYEKTERLRYSQLTCAQVNTRYVGFYQRHFGRSAA
jgi:hypothetical protein